MPQTETPTPLAGGIGAVTRYAGRQSFTREILKTQAQQRLRRQELARRVHRLGVRVLFELIDEIARRHGLGEDIDARLARYAQLDPEVLHKIGGDRFAPIPTRVVEVLAR